MYQDRHSRTLVHIVGVKQSSMDHLVQNRRGRSVNGPTKRGTFEKDVINTLDNLQLLDDPRPKKKRTHVDLKLDLRRRKMAFMHGSST